MIPVQIYHLAPATDLAGALHLQRNNKIPKIPLGICQQDLTKAHVVEAVIIQRASRLEPGAKKQNYEQKSHMYKTKIAR